MESAASHLGSVTTVEHLTSLDSLLHIEDEWAALHRASEIVTPFQHPDWMLPWANRFAPDAIWAFAFRSGDGRLVGLVPLFRYERERRRIVTFLGGGLSDHHELLALPDMTDIITRSFFDALIARSQDWDDCEFEQLAHESPLFASVLPPNLIEREKRKDTPSPVLHLPRPGAPLSSTVPGHQLARFRKYRRRAERMDSLVLVRADGDDCQAMFESFLELHGSCWRARNQAGMAADEAIRAFHREVVLKTAASGSLRLYALRLGTRDIASVYGFFDKGRLYCYWQGYDPEFSRMSPGMLLLGAVLEEAAKEGARSVDFLRGEEEYKFRWGAKGVPAYGRRIGKR